MKSLTEQIDALTNRCGMVELGQRTLLELTGEDRVTFLHNMCTNDISKLKPGQGTEAFLTNVQGKTIGHVLVFCRADSLILETVPGQAEKLLSHFDRYLIREDVELQDRTAWREFLVVGPQAASVIEETFATSVPQQLLEHTSASSDDSEVIIARAPWAEHALLVVEISGEEDVVRNRLSNASISTCDQTAFQSLRINHRFPWYGIDFGDDNLPQEIDRDSFAISFEKGCYLGQETVARIDALGHVNRMLTLLQSRSEIPVGAELKVDEKVVGTVSSVARALAGDGWIALGMVRREHRRPAATFQTDAATVQLSLASE